MFFPLHCTKPGDADQPHNQQDIGHGPEDGKPVGRGDRLALLLFIMLLNLPGFVIKPVFGQFVNAIFTHVVLSQELCGYGEFFRIGQYPIFGELDGKCFE